MNVSLWCEVEGKDHLPLPADNTFPSASQDVNIFSFPEETVILNHCFTTCQWVKYFHQYNVVRLQKLLYSAAPPGAYSYASLCTDAY